MSVINELYNPHWEAIHDYHHDHRERLQEKMRTFSKGDHQDPHTVSYGELERDFRFHHKTCLHILTRIQHKTVQDFAKWLFEHFSSEMDTSTVPPYEEFQSIDEAMALWQEIYDAELREKEQGWKILEEAMCRKDKTEPVSCSERPIVRGEPLIPVNQGFLSRLTQPLLRLFPY